MSDNQLPKEIENEVNKRLSNQPFGGIISDGDFYFGLVPHVTYTGENWIVVRKKVDYLDQITCSRIRK